jgi:hypothetical protein
MITIIEVESFGSWVAVSGESEFQHMLKVGTLGPEDRVKVRDTSTGRVRIVKASQVRLASGSATGRDEPTVAGRSKPAGSSVMTKRLWIFCSVPYLAWASVFICWVTFGIVSQFDRKNISVLSAAYYLFAYVPFVLILTAIVPMLLFRLGCGLVAWILRVGK